MSERERSEAGVASRRPRAALLVALLATGLAVTGCGPRETPEQRVSRLRHQYEVRPTGVQPRTTEDGTPELALDVVVLNTGRESLPALTFVVHVVGEDGSERVSRPVSVDTSDLIPGVTAQLSALVPGVTLGEGESVLLELEGEPDAAARATYPEYRAAVAEPT